MKNQLIIIAILILTLSCQSTMHEEDFLRKASDKLSAIKSASYYLTDTGSAPGDTTKFSEPRTRFMKIFINSADTLVGASTAIYSKEDTAKMIDFYDGKVRGELNWEKRTVRVDSFQNHPYPFRLVNYSMYTKVNEMLKYTLTTQDSIQTEYMDYGDSIHFSLKIINQHVYFHIKPIVVKNDYIPDDEISQFDIWFHKNDYLPYRMRSKWHHTTSFEEYSDAKFNTTEEESFVSTDYIPNDFEIIQFKRKTRKVKNSLEGKLAPDWILKDNENNTIGLKDLKSKVLMIQFTGVGCGPCHASLPFLKQLVVDYADKDFEFISIETWSKNIEGLIRYRDMNEMNFKFIRANEQIRKDYDISSVPVFLILDKDRIIRKVINGYGRASTDETIIKTINELL